MKEKNMKTAVTTAAGTTANTANNTLPKRRSILLERRAQAEQQQAHQQQLKQKKLAGQQREQKRKDFLAKPSVKVCASIGNAFWALLVSLILTLLASYLVANPQVFSTVTAPFEKILSANIAGAAPAPVTHASTALTSAVAQRDFISAELEVSRMFDKDFLDRKEEIILEMGTTRPYSSNGYTGTLALKKIEITPVVGTLTQKAERVVEFDQLPTNDVVQLPDTHTVSLRSDKEIGAEVDVDLRAAEWEWTVTQYDSFGLPKNYVALVTYRGEEIWLDYTAVQVEAIYSGRASRPSLVGDRGNQADSQGSRPTLTSFEEVEIVVNEAIQEEDLEPEPIQSQSQPEEVLEVADTDNTSRSWLPLIIGTAATLAAGTSAAAVVVFYRRKKRQNDA